MSRIVLLDAGPLGMVTNPKSSPETDRCNRWLEGLLLNGVEVAIPEIADYEVRRELLRADKTKGIQRLDALKTTLRYVPITTEAMLKAAEFWAEARKQGKPTADDKALDGDVILAAQATLVAGEGDEVVIATTNVGHLSRFVTAQLWEDIQAP
jgi:predicted nucleic acid-binding protein